ncbi:MAG: VTT domain-containing protein [Kiritimatiellia bacterium]
MKPTPSRSVLLFLFVSALIIIPFLIWGDAITDWFDRQMLHAAGHPVRSAAVLFGLLASDILLPVPSSLASTCCGMALGLGWGFVVSFLAMNTSAAIGYLLGRFCTGWAAKAIGERDMAALKRFIGANARWWLLLLRPVPVLAEASVLFAGIARLPPRRATVELLLGNAVVSAVYAAVGAWGRTADSMLPAFAATLAVSGICMIASKKHSLKAASARSARP